MSQSALNIGDTIGGRWRIDRYLASGGFGSVFAATDSSSADVGSVAVKVLLHGASTAERRNFLDEVRHMAALRHRNLVTHIDSGLIEDDEQGAVFLVTELCEESLADYRARQPGGTIPESQLAGIVADLSAGLTHLHRSGRIHRDLKPANILRLGEVWKLADFGLVRDLSSSGVYHLNNLAGTPRFMAPEFFHGGRVGPASDIWSIGVIVHELVTGTGVHHGEGGAFIHQLTSSEPAISPALQPGTAELVRRCLAATPEDRPDSADLSAILAGRSVAAPPVSPTETSQLPAGVAPPPAGLAPAATGSIGQDGAAPVAAGWAPPTGPRTPDETGVIVGAAPTESGTGRRRLALLGLLGLGSVLIAGAVIAAVLAARDGETDEPAAEAAGPLVASGEGASGEQPTGDASTDGDDAASTDADTDTDGADGTEGDADAAAAVAIGEEVALDGFRVGDCADPVVDGDRFVLRVVRACDAPHFFEVLALVEHPEAGGEYPGRDALFTFGSAQCREAFESRYGVDETDIALQVGSFHPSEQEWGANVFTVVCAVSRGDSQPLDRPIGDDVSEWIWKSGDTLNFLELQLGHCFDTPNALADAGLAQRVVYRDCDEPHDGEHYWSILLTDLGDGDYPSQEVLSRASFNRCHEILHEDYGEDHNDAGFTSTAVHPNQQEWEQFGAELGACLVQFDEPLDRPLAEIAAG